MWQQQQQEAGSDCVDGAAGKDDKYRVNSQADSGFLSGSNLISSELSIDLEHEESKDEAKVAPEPAKAIDSGLDLGLSDGLGQLSLKEGIESGLDSGTIDPDTEELGAEELKNQDLELWEIYYSQDDDGDT